MTLPPIPQKEGVDRNWSPETWRAGLDEAVKRDPSTTLVAWQSYCAFSYDGRNATIAHATTLIDHGIVKPVVSEADVLFCDVICTSGYGVPDLLNLDEKDIAAIAIIQSALDKARAGG